MDVLSAYPVRKSRKQKRAFREDVQALAAAWGYESRVEKGTLGARNLILGDPATAKYLVTAHYDTCARLPIPNLITPTSFWLFVLYQLAVAAVMLAIPLIPAIPVGLAFHSWQLGHGTWLIAFWVVFFLFFLGPANPHNANDNTSGVITLLEIARTLPEADRSLVCFVLFDLEEAGLLGSAGYQSRHKKQTPRQTVLNLDCVGEGDQLWLFPTKRLKKSREDMAALEKIAGTYGEKSILLRKRGFAVYPSDQANFPRGVGICALRQGRAAPWLGRIHTPRDTVLDEKNVHLLRNALTNLMQGKENEL
ncbi:MAG: M28 family peptidase [Eubacteriales bacterium]|nr:M28 family peptidase [Eubacteriales bacterium]